MILKRKTYSKKYSKKNDKPTSGDAVVGGTIGLWLSSHDPKIKKAFAEGIDASVKNNIQADLAKDLRPRVKKEALKDFDKYVGRALNESAGTVKKAQKTILKRAGGYAVAGALTGAAVGHTLNKKKKEKKFADSKKIGEVAGSLGIGAVGGVGLAKTLGKTNNLTEKLAEKIEWKSVKTKLPKGNKPGLIIKPLDSYKIQRGKTSQNLANTVKKSGEKITKLAKSKGGKIGLATAGALGTLGALTIKNKKK